MRIAVAGGTGQVGRHVMNAVEADGHEAVALARATGVDLVSGTGLGEALVGVDAVIDVTNRVTMRASSSVEFFTTVTRNLLAAEAHGGIAHHVLLSIVGIDEVDYGYYEGKRAQEKLVLGADVPVTVLRATQFHEFAGQLLDRMRGPVAMVPRMRVQPVAAREVGAALVRLATGTALGRAPDLGGPREETVAAMARKLLQAMGSRRRVVQVRMPGAAGKQMASGLLIPPDGTRGVQTFDEWLAGPDGPRPVPSP